MALLSVKRIIGEKSECTYIIPFQIQRTKSNCNKNYPSSWMPFSYEFTHAKDMFLNGKLGLYSPGNFLFYGCRYHLFYNRLSLSIYFWHGLSLYIYFWHFNFYFQITTIKHAHSRSYGLISSTTLRSPQKSLMVYRGVGALDKSKKGHEIGSSQGKLLRKRRLMRNILGKVGEREGEGESRVRFKTMGWTNHPFVKSRWFCCGSDVFCWEVMFFVGEVGFILLVRI